MPNDSKPSTPDSHLKANGARVEPDKLRTGMRVLDTEGVRLGVVNRIVGETTVRLKKDEKGIPHFIPLAWVTAVDESVHVDRSLVEARLQWTTEAPKT